MDRLVNYLAVGGTGIPSRQWEQRDQILKGAGIGQSWTLAKTACKFKDPFSYAAQLAKSPFSFGQTGDSFSKGEMSLWNGHQALLRAWLS